MLPGIVGVDLRGSSALRGFTSASDVDVLVIADGSWSRHGHFGWAASDDVVEVCRASDLVRRRAAVAAGVVALA
jgi:hypothetical protein